MGGFACGSKTGFIQRNVNLHEFGKFRLFLIRLRSGMARQKFLGAPYDSIGVGWFGFRVCQNLRDVFQIRTLPAFHGKSFRHRIILFQNPGAVTESEKAPRSENHDHKQQKNGVVFLPPFGGFSFRTFFTFVPRSGLLCHFLRFLQFFSNVISRRSGFRLGRLGRRLRFFRHFQGNRFRRRL